MKKIIIVFILILVIAELIFFFTLRSNKKDELMTNNKQVNDNEHSDNFSADNIIKIKINNFSYDVQLENNETTKELLELMPINITMNELNNNEKYYYFDSNFSTKNEKVRTINKGDILLYGSNCLVIFYDTFDTSYSYTRVGKIINPENLQEIVGTGKVNVLITK